MNVYKIVVNVTHLVSINIIYIIANINIINKSKKLIDIHNAIIGEHIVKT